MNQNISIEIRPPFLLIPPFEVRGFFVVIKIKWEAFSINRNFLTWL